MVQEKNITNDKLMDQEKKGKNNKDQINTEHPNTQNLKHV